MIQGKCKNSFRKRLDSATAEVKIIFLFFRIKEIKDRFGYDNNYSSISVLTRDIAHDLKDIS